ncbi:MAG TPA: MFS transporter [Candidatus Binatia bacterium]|jgi:MFS family permease|nr:MFS transporter [Candidatus Binatia bacterium]
MINVLRSNPTVRGLSALYTGTFFSGGWAMIIPTIPVLARQFGVSAGGAAQIVTAFAIGKFVGTVIAGVLLDRTGTRVALVAGPLVASVAALFVMWAPWFFLILFLALIMGAADSLWAIAREVAGIDLAHRSQRGRVISGLHGVNTIGAAFSPFVGGWLTESFSFKAAFVGYAIASAMSVPLGFIVPNFAVTQAGPVPPPATKRWHVAAIQRRLRGIKELYREIRPELRPTYCAITFATLVNQSQRMIVQSMLPLYAGYYLQLPPTQVGMLFTISGVIVFVMIIPAGFLMDRVGRKWCTVPSTGIPGLLFLLIPMTNSFTQLAILVGITGITQGLSLGSLATSTYDVVPAHARGRLQALRRTIAELGSSVAPMIGGYLANTFNPGVPFLVYAPLLLLSATLLAVVGKETLER